MKKRILIIVLFFSFCNLGYCQDTIKHIHRHHANTSIDIGFTYQAKENKSIAPKIIEAGTEIEFPLMHFGDKVHWDGIDSKGKRIGGMYYKNSFVNTLRVSGMYYLSNEPAYGLLIGDRIISEHSFIPIVIGLNFITNTNFSKYKVVFRPEVGFYFFKIHRLIFMIGLDMPINKVSFKYYDKIMPQFIVNYKLFNRINNYY